MGRSSTGTELKKSPTVYLTEKEGSKLTGVFQRAVESRVFPGQLSYLVAVEDTDASIRLYDGATKTETEVEVGEGEPVFVKGSTILNQAIRELNVKAGERITITYLGKGVAKPGRKAPYRYNVEVH